MIIAGFIAYELFKIRRGIYATGYFEYLMYMDITQCIDKYAHIYYICFIIHIEPMSHHTARR